MGYQNINETQEFEREPAAQNVLGINEQRQGEYICILLLDWK